MIEAIMNRINEAETKAISIRNEAEQKAKDIIAQAETNAKQTERTLTGKAKTEKKRIVENVQKTADENYNKKLLEGKKEAEKIAFIDEKVLNEKADLIVRRILNGDC